MTNPAPASTRPPAPRGTLDRALGALTGLALGDALGMPTQSMSRERVARTYGPITGLVDAVADQPIAPGMPAGSITDDTEQALLVADLLIEGGGRIDPHRFATAIADWEAAMEAKGSLDLLGPSTKAAIAAIQAGADPDESGRTGTTNGAAMRVAPIGIAFGPDPDTLLAGVVEASRVTHFTGLGLSGAAAVAAAVSVGVQEAAPGRAPTPDTTTSERQLAAAIDLAGRAARLGNWVAGGSIAARIRWATEAIAPMPETLALDFVTDVVGTSVQSQESVVAAFALAHRFDADPYAALCHAATIGGDTDTVAAIAGAVLGARYGMAAWPAEAVTRVDAVNDLDLGPVATRLLDLRGTTM